MEFIQITVLALFGFFMSFIFIYSLVQVNLIYNYLVYGKQKKTEGGDFFREQGYPYVTIQLPVYNERYVVQRLLHAVAAIDYPYNKMEIQVLDDSTDDTTAIIDQEIQSAQYKDINIYHLRRQNRVGYKAGALRYGLQSAKGSYIAVFDADFLPGPDFLRCTLPFFSDQNIGMVQTRWEHINQNYSLLTRMQAFGLNAHFSVEQTGRNAAGLFMNFNGTGGVWRKACIEDAGGWHHDTLTEDLDLSYRAQLNGWQFRYLEDMASPGELPVAMNALKTQQFRWTKGAAECARKNLMKVIKAKNISLYTKVHAVFHLLNSFLFVCIIGMALLSIPYIFISKVTPAFAPFFKWASVFMLSFFIITWFYWESRACKPKNIGDVFRYAGDFLLFLSVSMGLSLHNAIAVIEGYMGRKTPFIRTPKFNIKNPGDQWKKNKYFIKNLSFLTWIEGLLMIYFIFGSGMGIYYHDWGLLPFHIMLSIGFGTVFFYTLFHTWSKVKTI